MLRNLRFLLYALAVLVAARGWVMAAPTISSFSPTYGSATDPSYINIFGSGFTPGTVVVKFNGVSAALGTVQPTVIQALVPAGAPLGSGPIYVSVGGVATESADDFTVIGPGPYVSGFSPVIGSAGATMTISGAHFTSSMTVRFNGASVAASSASPTLFTVTVPNGTMSGPVTVSNSLGSWTTPTNFYVPPVISGFSPTNGRAGTNVIISGTNFLNAAAVRFNGVDAASFTVLSNGAIQATAPAGVTTGPLRVIAPAGSASTTSLATSNFVVLPTVTSFAPNFGLPGTSVIISGANLNVGTPTVKFGGVTATTVSNVSFGQLTATVPNGATTGPISVQTTDGTATSTTLFYLPPRISGFSPSNSPPGSVIHIRGTNFTDASAVSFNGVPAAGFTVTNNNNLGAVVPAGFVTGPIGVTTPAGTTLSTNLAASNYYAAPIISSFTPLHGLPGSNITVFGSSFLGASAVRFAAPSGTTNGIIQSVVNGQIVVRVPTNAITGPITVVAPAGTDTSSSSFFLDYADLLLTVNDAPDPVVVGGNLTYSIAVKNFGPFASTVALTNVLPPGVTFVSTSVGTNTANVIAANLGTLAVGATANVTIVVQPNTPGVTLTNQTIAVSGPAAAYTPVVTTTYVEPLPLLSIGFYSPGVVLLSWPTALSNYTLQYKDGLGSNFSWVDVLTAPATNGGSNLVAEPHSGAAKFYRLRR